MKQLNQRLSPLALIAVLMSLLLFQGSFLQAVQDDGTKQIQERLALGNTQSPIQIYVVSDWYCKSCKKLEPKIEELYADLKSKAAFFFVDYAINRQSANFTPYHLAFLINEKGNYIKARQTLIELTAQTNKPSDEDIENFAKAYGLNFEELSFEDVKNGMEFFDEVVKKYGITETPTIVVVNTANEKFEKFKGSQIKDKKILEAIKKLEGKTKAKKSWFSF